MENQIEPRDFFEHSAWVLFLVLGVLEILFGLGDTVAGVENDPAILISATGMTPAELKARDPVMYATLDHKQKVIGQVLWMTGALITSLSLTAFRHGARWAWFTFWLIPASMIFVVVSSYHNHRPGEALAPPFYSGMIFAILTTVWLAASYKKYLSKEKT